MSDISPQQQQSPEQDNAALQDAQDVPVDSMMTDDEPQRINAENTAEMPAQDSATSTDHDTITNQPFSHPNLQLAAYNPEDDEDDALNDVSPIPMVSTGSSSKDLYYFNDDDDDDDEQYNYSMGRSMHHHQMVTGTSSDDDMGADDHLWTLEGALKKDHVVQDVQISNPRILKVLRDPENLLQLLKYVTEPHYLGAAEERQRDYTEDEVNRYFKYPYLAQQIFMVQHDGLNPHIVQSEANLKQLFGFLQVMDPKKQHTNHLLPQFYIKTMTTLLKEFYTPMAKFFMSQDDDAILRAMLFNIETAEMHTLILKMLGYDSQEESVIEGWREMLFVDTIEPDKEAEEHKRLAKQWALNNGFVKHVLDKLRSDVNDSNAQENMFSLLEVIIDTETVLAEALLSKDFMGALLDLILSNSESSLFEHGMRFLECIFHRAEKHPECMEAIFDRTEQFVHLLDKTPNVVVHTPHGKLDPPLGEHRLLATRHISMLYSTQNESVLSRLQDYSVLSKLVALFFQYPFNNLLHCQCQQIFEMILRSDSDEAIMYLLSHAQLLKLIFATLKKDYEAPLVSAVGFMGHLVKIGIALNKAMESPQIDQYVKSFEEWKTFQEYIRDENRKYSLALGDSY